MQKLKTICDIHNRRATTLHLPKQRLEPMQLQPASVLEKKVLPILIRIAFCPNQTSGLDSPLANLNCFCVCYIYREHVLNCGYSKQDLRYTSVWPPCCTKSLNWSSCLVPLVGNCLAICRGNKLDKACGANPCAIL